MTTFGLWAARLIGVAYLLLGLWCSAAPRAVAKRVGFSLESDAGLSEFVTVYGGLEIGLGAALVLTSLYPGLRDGGLVFGAIFSLALPVFRLATILRYDDTRGVLGLFVVEILFAAALSVPAWSALQRAT